eukprot:6931929-Pyramimonas_sp.AAC.1
MSIGTLWGHIGDIWEGIDRMMGGSSMSALPPFRSPRNRLLETSSGSLGGLWAVSRPSWGSLRALTGALERLLGQSSRISIKGGEGPN